MSIAGIISTNSAAFSEQVASWSGEKRIVSK